MAAAVACVALGAAKVSASLLIPRGNSRPRRRLAPYGKSAVFWTPPTVLVSVCSEPVLAKRSFFFLQRKPWGNAKQSVSAPERGLLCRILDCVGAVQCIPGHGLLVSWVREVFVKPHPPFAREAGAVHHGKCPAKPPNCLQFP